MTNSQQTSAKSFFEDVVQTLGNRQLRVYEIMASPKRKNWTNSEIAHALGWPINTITPRIHELRHKQNPVVCEDEKRPCRIPGRTAIAWRLVQNTLF